jgi:hypothetical protein
VSEFFARPIPRSSADNNAVRDFDSSVKLFTRTSDDYAAEGRAVGCWL